MAIVDKTIESHGEQWHTSLEHDDHNRPEHFECYTPAQIKAWMHDEWCFVTVVVRSDKGEEATVSGVEYGDLPGVPCITLDTMCAPGGHVGDLVEEILGNRVTRDHVVVVFGDKRKHSDVLGPYTLAEAERVKARREEREPNFEVIVFPIQTEAAYVAWLKGE